MKKLAVFVSILLGFLIFSTRAQANQPAIGIHLLDVQELKQATDLVAGTPENPGAVTVVLRSDDRNLTKWQKFFDLAKEHNITPIIRLATEPDKSGWRRPVKKDIVDHAKFLSFINWHADQLVIAAFNEPNHAGEWGGEVDPQSYAQMLNFTLDWFHTEHKQFIVLPAGLDAAAPNGNATMDSFTFLDQVIAAEPQIPDKIDAWNTHSYPNPGFVASPRKSDKASIKGFEHELAYIKQYTDRNLDVYITETGWKRTPNNSSHLSEYYSYAIKNTWNDERVKAVTPFVFAAHSGPFQAFSFTNQDGSPTPQYQAWKNLKPQPESQLSLLVKQNLNNKTSF